jgi:hypothetical protein
VQIMRESISPSPDIQACDLGRDAHVPRHLTLKYSGGCIRAINVVPCRIISTRGRLRNERHVPARGAQGASGGRKMLRAFRMSGGSDYDIGDTAGIRCIRDTIRPTGTSSTPWTPPTTSACTWAAKYCAAISRPPTAARPYSPPTRGAAASATYGIRRTTAWTILRRRQPLQRAGERHHTQGRRQR